MGTYFNPGNGSFRQAVNSQIYVDKTGLLCELNKLIGTEKKCVAVSRARRFGKSQAAAMVGAYYSLGSNSGELFSAFEIAKDKNFKKHLNQYNVIHLDVATFTDSYRESLVEELTRYLFDEFRAQYPDIDYSKSLPAVIMEIFRISGLQFVIIIDEWDCVVRNLSKDQKLVHKYMQFLHMLFKSEESRQFLALGYITGILPIKKIKDESALNNFLEFTMLDSEMMTPYFGFTEDEVKKLCIQYGKDFESMKQWYNGYLINGRHMYNPNSVYNACIFSGYKSYWKDTSSFETITNLICMNFDGLKDAVIKVLEGGTVSVSTYDFSNDLSLIETFDDALTAMIHLGYLGYNAASEEAYMPNYEVSLVFRAAIRKTGWGNISKALDRCQELLTATVCGNAKRVAELIELAHESYTSVIKYNDENSLSCVITMAYFTAPAYYNVIRELPAGKGFADIAFIPRADTKDKPAMLIELKWNKDADTALKQIKEKRYDGALRGWSDEVLLVGISYGKDKKHVCSIVKEMIR